MGNIGLNWIWNENLKDLFSNNTRPFRYVLENRALELNDYLTKCNSVAKNTCNQTNEFSTTLLMLAALKGFLVIAKQVKSKISQFGDQLAT